MNLFFFLTLGLAGAMPLAATGIVAEDVEIFVNAQGQALSTKTMLATQILPVVAAAAATPSAVAAHAAVPAAISHSIAPVPSYPVSSPAPAAPSHSSSSSSSAAPAPAGTGIAFGTGITYSPYTASGGCKSASQVAADLAGLGSYAVIRLYGTDCNQVANVLAAPGTRSARVVAGLVDVGAAAVTAETASLIAQVDGRWARLHSVTVGNELVNSGAATVAQVVAGIATARTALRAAGYTGPVATVDTMVAHVANPALCGASDYCAVNCHAFFDGHALPANAGTFVRGWLSRIEALAPGKSTVVTESGWPSAGQPNGAAVPSPQNQQTAVASLSAALPQNLILYTAYNDPWKKNTAATFDAEAFWGLNGNAPSG